MKTTPQTDSNLLIDATPLADTIADRTAVTDFAYRQLRGAKQPITAARPMIFVPEVNGLRVLTRQVLAGKPTWENLKELLVFGGLMVAAIWTAAATVSQLNLLTSIRPPAGLW